MKAAAMRKMAKYLLALVVVLDEDSARIRGKNH
jgi:hypothetical protein